MSDVTTAKGLAKALRDLGDEYVCAWQDAMEGRPNKMPDVAHRIWSLLGPTALLLDEVSVAFPHPALEAEEVPEEKSHWEEAAEERQTMMANLRAFRKGTAHQRALDMGDFTSYDQVAQAEPKGTKAKDRLERIEAKLDALLASRSAI